MKRALLALLILLPISLLADETFRIEMRVLELDPTAPAPTDFPAANSTPLSSSMTVKTGQQGRVDLGRAFKLRDVTSGGTNDIPIGVTLQVTPVFKDAQLMYRAQVTHSAPIFSTSASLPHSAAEIVTSSFYQSGPCEGGKPVWFNYKNPENGKTMFVALRLTKESA